jgi:hypothetical protein
MTKPPQGFHDFCGGFVFNNHQKLGFNRCAMCIWARCGNDNTPMLIVVMALTTPIAMLAMRLAERAMKKQAATLN